MNILQDHVKIFYDPKHLVYITGSLREYILFVAGISGLSSLHIRLRQHKSLFKVLPRFLSGIFSFIVVICYSLLTSINTVAFSYSFNLFLFSFKIITSTRYLCRLYSVSVYIKGFIVDLHNCFPAYS